LARPLSLVQQVLDEQLLMAIQSRAVRLLELVA
jgi:hypothetical protein